MNDLNTILEKPGQSDNALVQIAQERAIAEVQARMTLAQARPRDEAQARDKIIAACARPGLAATAVYAYPRGGEMVTGPSIRLAEVLARYWRNIDCGIRELSQTGGMSIGEAYAFDLETNHRQAIEFQIPHLRKTKKGTKTLDDPRDIYEMFANLASRRMRACILRLIPADIAEDAVAECKRTQAANVDITQEKVRAMLSAFEKDYGVTEEMIRARLGHDIGAIIPSEFLQLRRIYQSLRDGFSKPDQYFEAPTAADKMNETLRNGATVKRDDTQQRQPETPPADEPTLAQVDEKTIDWVDDDATSGPWPQELKALDGTITIVDSAGAIFDQEVHVLGPDDEPSMNKDGTFRARRGMAAEAAKREKAPF